MNIAKITTITQNGKPWSFTDDKGTQKTMYPHDVAFDDGQSGQTNAMSVPPPYKVGDSVGYEINGQTPRGANKLKITRKPKPGQGVVTSPPPMDTSNPDLEAVTRPAAPFSQREQAWHQPARSVAQNAPSAHSTPIHGATVGGALARAVDIAIKQNCADDMAFIEKTTRALVAIQQRIEAGEPPTEEIPF